MATLKTTVKPIDWKSLGIVAALYVSFRYFLDFSSQLSFVLTGFGWLVYGLYEKLNALQRSKEAFSPFSVSIYPNWYPLLSDFRLVSSKEEWHRFCEEMGKTPAGDYSVFRSGILFTVVSPPSDDGPPPGLTYWNNRNRFASKVELSESIVEYTGHKGEHPFFKHPKWGALPEVYFKIGIGGMGYELGLEVQRDWWEHVCETGNIGELAAIKTHTDYSCGTTRLVIATLPLSAFGLYFEDIDYDHKQLEANGWVRKVEKDAEIQDPWERLEHKYFSVSSLKI